MKRQDENSRYENNDVLELAERETWNRFSSELGWRKHIGLKRIVVGMLWAVFIGSAWYLRQMGFLDMDVMLTFVTNYPCMAPLIFIALYALGVFLMLPTLPLNLAAGMLWGPVYGAFVALTGSCLGGVGAFVLSRKILGQSLKGRYDNQLVTWLERQLETKGWQIVAFTRINPVIPSGPLNFAFGLTSIGFFTYAWSSFVFLFPLTLAFSIAGHVVGDFILEGNMADIVRVVFIFFAIVTLIVVAQIGTKFMIYNKKKESR